MIRMCDMYDDTAELASHPDFGCSQLSVLWGEGGVNSMLELDIDSIINSYLESIP